MYRYQKDRVDGLKDRTILYFSVRDFINYQKDRVDGLKDRTRIQYTIHMTYKKIEQKIELVL